VLGDLCLREERLRRGRDLYEFGDLTRLEYTARCDAINTELAACTPGPLPDLDQAQEVLEDFSIFWQRERAPAAKRQLLALISSASGLTSSASSRSNPSPHSPPTSKPRLGKPPEGRCV
jgi:hypothetical protein